MPRKVPMEVHSANSVRSGPTPRSWSDSRPLSFGCSCSRERVSAMLQSLGEEEAMAAAADGVAEIRCAFCGQQYHYDADQIAGLFQRHGLEMEAPDRLQ
jgi:molecular chaperone Hsp33